MRCRIIEKNNDKYTLVFFKSKGVSNNKFGGELIYNGKSYALNGTYENDIYTSDNIVIDLKNNIIKLDDTTIVEDLSYNEECGLAVGDNYRLEMHPSSILIDKTYADGKDGTCQSLNQRLMLIQHELQHYMNLGFPLMNGKCNKLMLDSYVIDVISEHPDITQILNMKSSVVNHNYVCDLVLNTKYGEISMSAYQSL